jgi:amino acid adenylation domain-containing protein
VNINLQDEKATNLNKFGQAMHQPLFESNESLKSELPMTTSFQNHGVLRLFEQKAQQTPNAIALVFENQQISYQELNSRSNQLANYLCARGVKPEVLVGICLERSIEMIVGILAILKTGGAYVPLDSNYPKDRLEFMVADTQLSLLLTTKNLNDQLFSDQQSSIPLGTVFVDTEFQDISRQSAESPISQIIDDSLAYIIYTSGSTGKPKGVQISHRNILEYLQSINQTMQIDVNDIYLHTASFSFSSSVRQLLLPLSQGSRIVLASHEQIRNPISLWELIQQQGVTIFDTVQSVWRYGLEALENLDRESARELLNSRLRLIVFSGGLLPCQLLQNIRHHLTTKPAIVNVYGQTETIGVSAYPIPSEFDKSEGYVPVGYPFNHVQTYVLDSDLQPVKIGDKGELHVAVNSTLRGYLNRSDLNHQQFINNPFNHDFQNGSQNDRANLLYKTGDIARYLPDGALEILGRVDYQVKIREMRIELGEIELILEQHPNVRQSVVVAIEDALTGDRHLVGYVVAKVSVNDALNEISSQLLIRELRDFLKEKLPEYMQLSGFVILDSLPMTPNGKIDRQALPEPNFTNSQTESKFVPPNNPTQEILANIWADILGLEQIGIEDNFFDLGGHSLLVIQVVLRSRQAFDVDIPLQALFESSTISSFSELILELQAQDIALVEQSIVPRIDHNSTPLSFSQEIMWFGEQLNPDSLVYINEAFRLNGNLDIPIIQRSLEAIVAHHEVLRTNFILQDGRPMQVIRAIAPFDLEVIDLRGLAPTEIDSQLPTLLQQKTQERFDLESDLMLRATLFQLNDLENILLLVLHHIVSDGWSMGILRQQLTQLYNAFSTGKPNPLSPLPIQYADYAWWQREWVQSGLLDKQINYWEKQLEGVNPVLNLPIDRPRPAIQKDFGANQAVVIPVDLSKALKQIARKEGVTLFMVLLAAFQILLYRYSHQEDITVGSVVAGRNRSELENLIGLFINFLALRTDLTGNPSFKELLQRVRTVSLEAYANSDLPFDKLLEYLNFERSLSYKPLFQVMFILQNTPNYHLEIEGMTGVSQKIDNLRCGMDLTLQLQEYPENIRGTLTYNTDLFNHDTILRILNHFQILLEAIAKDPEQPIASLPILTASEQELFLFPYQHRVNLEINAPVDELETLVYKLFEKQARLTPNAIAVRYIDRTLTYQQLNAKANQLAHYLRSIGVGADQFVGITVERNLEMIVGIMAILKAGAAYVPLDPDYPRDRLAYMIDDAQISILLTQEQYISQLPTSEASISETPISEIQIICLDTNWNDISTFSEENPSSINTLENIAYLIYTSGSTGQPKGVIISHQALSSFTKSAIAEYKVTSSDRILQFASINFDAAIEEIYCSLCTGATLVLRTDAMIADSRTFLQTCGDWQVTVLDLPTAYWHQLVADLEVVNSSSTKTSTKINLSLPDSIRLVIIGGEKVLPEAVKAWQKYVIASQKEGQLQLVNTYGPTETTVVASTYWISGNAAFSGEVPIGRAIAHIETYVLDSHLQLVPIGVAGELHIGGDSLSNGYLHRPELTATKFIPNPFSNSRKDPLYKGLYQRLYKTGDLVRYLPDGNLEFIGRIDDQVKIRGFRIELGEIESILTQHPDVREVAIIVREETPNNKRLVAFVVISTVFQSALKSEQVRELDTIKSSLRQFLQERLPNYMLPSAFVFLDSLPITPNGKIDRRILSNLDIANIQSDSNFVAPTNSTEEVLTKIWAEVLGVERVGIHDNFFELGGHSLLSVRLVFEMEKALKYHFPLKSLFQIGTIAEIAKFIKEQDTEESLVEDVPVGLSIDDYRALLSLRAGMTGARMGKRGLIVNIPPAVELTSQPFVWIGEVKTGKRLRLKQPLYVMPGASLSSSMNSYKDYVSVIASLLVDELLSAKPSDSYSLGGWCYNGLVAMEMAQQLKKLGKQVDLLTFVDVPGRSLIYDSVRRLNSYLGTIRFHLYNLRKLSFAKKLNYITERIILKINPLEYSNLADNKFDGKIETEQVISLLLQAFKKYTPKPYSGKVLMVIGNEQIVHGQRGIKHFDISGLFPYNGWGNLLNGRVLVEKMQCDHLDLMENPYCEKIGNTIQRITTSRDI